ncbi:MAG: DUF3365 domain-containing protein [Nitrospirae bacterium]|nr:DUF3365 domain-containing protein [Nitrospirota bacterium]
MTEENFLGFGSLISKSRRALFAWTVLLLVMFSYEAYDHWEDAEESALIAGRSLIEKDITYRKWNAQHGGVYALVTEKTPPNPYLTQIPERDIETPSGKKLTLINPAYMTRQIHELENAETGIRGHITSLKLLRPENRADDWEIGALKAFERGATEVASVEVLGGKKYLRAMHPLRTDKACLKCHAFQGYQEGDIRGAISASIPMQPFYAGMYKSMAKEGFLYFIYWLAGAGLILSRSQRQEKNAIALRQSEERYRTMVNNSPVCIHEIDINGRIISMNSAGLSMMGFHAERDVQGLLYLDAVSPEDRERIGGLLQRAYEGENGYFEFKSNGSQGQIYKSCFVPIINKQGVVEKLLGITEDITARKQAEKNLTDSEKMFRIMSSQFTALLNAIPDSITLLSSDYKILWANRVAGERIALDPLAMEGEYCYRLWFNRDEICEDCPARKSFQSGHTVEKHVLMQARKLEVRTVPVMGPDGVVNVIRVGRDITEHQKLEEQLRQSQKMESVGTLAGGIAHDFNNILSAIIGYGQLAAMKMEPDNPFRKNVENMLVAADKAAYLTQGLLSFSRRQMSIRKQVDLNTLLNKSEMFLRRVIGEDIEFRTNLHENSIMVSADPNQIEQILMNLATNARDAMPNGGILAVTTDQVRLDEGFSKRHGYGTPGRYGMITVTDNGIGMDEETRQRIFEPFFTTKEVGKGTGLGLAIIYGIIKQHGGFIDVYSEPGEGTAFKVYLPVAAAALQETAITEEPDCPEGGTETILLAEDDEILRKLSGSVLEEFGYTVIVAFDGEDAIHKFQDNKDRIDLLLTDLVMPKKSGKEVYDKLKKIKPAIKVIFASGYSPDTVRDKISLSDAAIVYKPISPMDLLKKVRETLDQNKCQRG